MKRFIIFLITCSFLLTSCLKGLLDQIPPDVISKDMSWKTITDAKGAVSGVYAAMSDYFETDYKYDGNVDTGYGQANGNESGSPDGMRNAWDGCYKIVNRANSTLEGLNNMLKSETNTTNRNLLIRLDAETRFLRAMAYFRLIDMFGDVPYVFRSISHEEAIQLTRTPVTTIRDSIMKDLNNAISLLPGRYDASDYGRATKWTALSYHGKLNLFWACWLKDRPEWSNISESPATYYLNARDDFKTIINEGGYALFKDGDPGTYSKPNYQYLFQLENEACEEIIFSTVATGPLMGLGNELKKIFSSRQGGNNGALEPTIIFVNKYLKLDGSKADPLVPSKNTTLLNSCTNRASYVGRDWRMRATILWDGEKVLLQNLDGTAFAKDSAMFLWGNKGTGSLDDPYYDWYNNKIGYGWRKWMPTYGGYSREDCPQDFYLVRYADILLMYCEAENEVNAGPTAELQDIINLIRKRGNIAPSASIAGLSKQDFFDLLVEERAVEFIAEGQRYFDIRRWRLAEKIWNNGAGYTLTDTWGVKVQDEFLNAQPIQFERFYISQIPNSEILLNKNLVQNQPWL